MFVVFPSQPLIYDDGKQRTCSRGSCVSTTGVEAAVYQPLLNLERDAWWCDGPVLLGVFCRFIWFSEDHDGSTAPGLRKLTSMERTNTAGSCLCALVNDELRWILSR